MAALLNAVNSGNESTLSQLIANSPGSKNVEFQRYSNLVPFTPLLRAVSIGNQEMVRRLLEKGANPNLANLYGATPLGLAAENNNLAIVRLLLEYGADPSAAESFFEPNSSVNQTLRNHIHSASTRRTRRRKQKQRKSLKRKRY
jgi:ankyrin repeat protein